MFSLGLTLLFPVEDRLDYILVQGLRAQKRRTLVLLEPTLRYCWLGHSKTICTLQEANRRLAASTYQRFKLVHGRKKPWFAEGFVLEVGQDLKGIIVARILEINWGCWECWECLVCLFFVAVVLNLFDLREETEKDLGFGLGSCEFVRFLRVGRNWRWNKHLLILHW